MESLPNQSQERYQQLDPLGRGAYSQVFRGVDTQNNKVVAMKKINLRFDQEGIPRSAVREISILRQLSHPNIVHLLDVVYTNERLFLIFEYLETDLRKFITEHDVLAFPLIKQILRQLLEALKECHSYRFIHRDVKPDNILVDSQAGQVRLADFGLSRVFQIPAKPYTKDMQTLWYRAPEVLLGADVYSVAVDIWSVGCVFAEMLKKRPLFPGTNDLDQIHKIFEVMGTPSEDKWPNVTTLPAFPHNVQPYPGQNLSELFEELDPNALHLLQAMLTMDPSQRISAKAALIHPFFND